MPSTSTKAELPALPLARIVNRAVIGEESFRSVGGDGIQVGQVGGLIAAVGKETIAENEIIERKVWDGNCRRQKVSKRSLAPYKPSRSKPMPVLNPDLAVEVLSKSNTPKESELKLRQYFTSRVRLAWAIDPKRRNATIHTSLTERMAIELDGVLNGGKVVPGFQVLLRELFDRADQMLEDLDEK